MDVRKEKVFTKIEELAKQAKMAVSPNKQQSCITAIKVLCELLEDEQDQLPVIPEYAAGNQVLDVKQLSTTEKPIQLDDANGTSLLDF